MPDYRVRDKRDIDRQGLFICQRVFQSNNLHNNILNCFDLDFGAGGAALRNDSPGNDSIEFIYKGDKGISAYDADNQDSKHRENDKCKCRVCRRFKVPPSEFKPRVYNEVEDLQNNSEDESALQRVAALKEQQAKRRQREVRNGRIYIDDVDEEGNVKHTKRDKYA